MSDVNRLQFLKIPKFLSLIHTETYTSSERKAFPGHPSM